MEEKDGEFSFGGWSKEDGVIAVWVEASGDGGARRTVDAEALGRESDAAVWSDAGGRTDAPDVGPPRTLWGWSHGGAVFLAREIPGGLRGGGDLAVLFFGVVVEAQRVDQEIGLGKGGDVFGGEEGGEAFLPEVVCPFDLALGLRGGRVAQGDLVETQGGTELGKGLGLVGEEKGMVVDVERQGQAVGGEGGGKEIEMSQEGLARIKPCEREQAAVKSR